MSEPATARDVLFDFDGDREDGDARLQLQASPEPDRVVSPNVVKVDPDDEMYGGGKKDVETGGKIAGQSIFKELKPKASRRFCVPQSQSTYRVTHQDSKNLPLT